MNDFVLVNGQAIETISCFDRGLQFGDGLFETLRWRHDRVVLFECHYDRLCRGAKVLSLCPPDRDQLKQEIDQLCHGLEDQLIKLIVTRGNAARGYAFPVEQKETRILSRFPFDPAPNEWYQRGIRLSVCQTRLASPSPLAGVKHLNRLEQVIARNEISSKIGEDGLLLDSFGCVIEATSSNLFMYHNQRWHTPCLDSAGVAGVIRDYLIAHLSGTRSVEIRSMSLEDLSMADELFICNTVFGIVPIREIMNVGRYELGPKAQLLMALLAKLYV